MLAGLLFAYATAGVLAIDAPDPRRAVACIDPAGPLQQLALGYDRWPAPDKGVATKAFALLRKAMESRRPVDYGNAINKYRNTSGNAILSTDPHIRLALSLLYATGYEFNFDNTTYYRHNRPQYNTNAERIAGDLLPKLVEEDPRQWLAAVALARVAMGSRAEGRFAQARAALAKVIAAEPTNVTAHLAWRDLLIAQDSVKAANDYMALHSADCPAVMHAQAESMIMLGDTARGSRLYLSALERAQPDELDRFYQDLLVMADRDDLKRYSATPEAQKPAWIRAFWQRNALIYGRTVETRVAEQIGRVAFADANFLRDRVQSVVTSRNGLRSLSEPAVREKPNPLESRDAFVEDSSQSVPWDLRGVMYVRHGPPLHRLRMAGTCNSYEAWVYTTDDAPWVLAFERQCGANDWKLEQNFTCGPDVYGAFTPQSGEEAIARAVARPDSLDRAHIYEVLARYDPRYADIGRVCASGVPDPRVAQLVRDIVNERRHLVEKVEWGGTAFRQFLFALPLEVATYQFRNAGGEPELDVVTWIPARDLSARPAPLAADRVRTLDITTTLTDSADGTPRQRRQNVTVPATLPGSESALVRTAFMLQPPAGAATLAIVASSVDDSTRGAMRTRQLSIRAAGSGLDASDIVIAQSGAAGPLKRGAFQVAPLPAHTISVGNPVRIFFEMYGLRENEDVKQTIRVIRTSKSGVRELLNVFPGKRDERTITFAEKAHPVAGVTTRDIDLAGELIPGDYDVEITVESPGGSVRRHATLRVAAPN